MPSRSVVSTKFPAGGGACPRKVEPHPTATAITRAAKIACPILRGEFFIASYTLHPIPYILVFTPPAPSSSAATPPTNPPPSNSPVLPPRETPSSSHPNTPAATPAAQSPPTSSDPHPQLPAGSLPTPRAAAAPPSANASHTT